jgi:hypothetical protein
MSFIQNLFTSRDNNANAETYVGQQDRLWYSPNTNAIYVNSANVAGGTPVTLPATANLVINTITANSGNITGNLIVSGNISPATTAKIGGVRAGPGANISNDGLLTIDTAGLPFSFGDFTANANLLTLVNVDQNMVIATQGNAEVQLVGNIGFYKVDGFPPSISNRYASFSDAGIVEIKVTATGNTGAVNIIGSSSGNEIPPGQPGTMLHITGQLDTPCRLYYDGNGDYVSMVARRFNGNVDVPTQVLANEDVLRINSTAATNAGVGNVGMAQIRTTALENQTTTAQGSSITFTVTPIGSPANARVDVANITVANGITATKFTTAGTVIATGNITGGNVTTAGIASTGSLTASTTISATGNITGGNILTGGAVSATGGITSGDGISDSKGDVRSIPLNTQNTGYTLVATDAGKLINMTTGNVTVPASVFAAPFGQAITIYNNQNSSNAIVQGSGVTLRLAGTAATGNRTLSRYSLATLVCVSANTFVISGAGLT